MPALPFSAYLLLFSYHHWFVYLRLCVSHVFLHYSLYLCVALIYAHVSASLPGRLINDSTSIQSGCTYSSSKADAISISSEMGINGDSNTEGRRSSDAQAVWPSPVRPAPRLPMLSDQQHCTTTVRRPAPPIPPRWVSVRLLRSFEAEGNRLFILSRIPKQRIPFEQSVAFALVRNPFMICLNNFLSSPIAKTRIYSLCYFSLPIQTITQTPHIDPTRPINDPMRTQLDWDRILLVTI